MGTSHFLLLVGRIALSAIFLSAGIGKIFNYQSTADKMANEGVPFVTIALPGAIALLLLGSLSVITGLRGRLGATALIIFLVPATYYFHDFWTLTDPQEKQLQMIQFLKNIAILGGLLFLIGCGPGSLSLKALPKRKKTGGG